MGYAPNSETFSILLEFYSKTGNVVKASNSFSLLTLPAAKRKAGSRGRSTARLFKSAVVHKVRGVDHPIHWWCRGWGVDDWE
jgi:hypothetical protein